MIYTRSDSNESKRQVIDEYLYETRSDELLLYKCYSGLYIKIDAPTFNASKDTVTNDYRAPERYSAINFP